MQNNDVQKAKQAAGKAAAALIQTGMRIGLGTGSTAIFFIDSLIERCRNDGLEISVFPSSERSAKQALAGGIPLCDENVVTSLDITVDGADEIDDKKRMIKGGGGAMLRERIVAGMSQEMIVIVDPNKVVNELGGCPLPLEVVPFAYHATLHNVRSRGYEGAMRIDRDGKLFVTDNGNYIIDVKFRTRCHSPELDDAILRSIPGVVETGFFFGMAGRVIIGQFDGSVKIV